MVRISIYNEKGGVGKTTMTAMLASYLAYAKGKSVPPFGVSDPQ